MTPYTPKNKMADTHNVPNTFIVILFWNITPTIDAKNNHELFSTLEHVLPFPTTAF